MERLGRRRLLRGMLGGAAVAVGLPPLQAMRGSGPPTAAKRDASKPLRLITFFFGNGVQLRRFEPRQVGAAWELSEQLAPLAPVKDYITVCSGLRNRTASDPIGHHEGMTILSGYDYVRSDAGPFASNWGGPTIDQVVADSVARRFATPVHSLQVGVAPPTRSPDSGSAARSISARGQPAALRSLLPQRDPRRVWRALFGQDARASGSVLGAVRDEAAALRSGLGREDAHRVDAHLHDVAALERRIAELAPSCDAPAPPAAGGEGRGHEHIARVNRAMSELIAYAFACDRTRVASHMFCGMASDAVLDNATAAPVGHHVRSHNDDEGYASNIRFIIGCLADLMLTLQATPDADEESLLDSTLILATSDVSQGWSHSYQRQPILIGGHGRHYLRHPGIHVQAAPRTGPHDDATASGNTTDVLLTLARAFDPDIASVGAGQMRSVTPLGNIVARV